MTLTDNFQALRELIDIILDDEASEADIEQLNLKLKDNPEAQQFYYEYISMHMHLKSAAKHNVEFVYRRMSEEFIVRPAEQPEKIKNVIESDSTESKPALGNTLTNTPADPTTEANKDDTRKPIKPIFYLLFAFVGLLLLAIAWYSLERSSSSFTAKILQGQLSILELGKIDADLLSPGEYKIEQASRLELKDGDILDLVPNSVIKIFNNNEVELIAGKLEIEPTSGHNILVHGPNFQLFSNGDGLVVDLTSNQPLVKTGGNTLLVPTIWRPRHYWSFNEMGESVIDSAGRADGTVSPDTSRVDGLLGTGAFYFNNTAAAKINVGNGGGIAPASGSFSVRDGITIEALIRPNYSGLEGDDDHIFRKDQSDGNLRILLSFQNDSGKDYLRPRGEYNESISFGLFLLGQGYQELKLPLDGLNGRPTLAQLKDGKPHHIVATYDAASGYKMIYIDGKKHASFRYLIGSKILSGGRGMAHIGNNPNAPATESEAFDGVIDEVAFYDFALPPYMVNDHYQQVKTKLNYFGLFPSTEQLPQSIKMPLPAETWLAIDVSTGLPHHRVIP